MITHLTSIIAQGAAGSQAATTVGRGETVLFWCVAPLMVAAALGLLFAKKAVHAALCMAFVMISLAVMYAALGAQFLFAAQIVVYTGAIMMLFLFVLMLVGVDSIDSYRAKIKGHTWVTGVAGAGLVFVLLGLVAGAFDKGAGLKIPVGSLDAANKDGNPQGVAKLIFSEYVVTLELVGTLLISAALGAIIMTHRERLTKRKTQGEMASERVRSGRFVAGLPAPGVFARHNSVDTPALLPDGSVATASIQRVVEARDQVLESDGLDDPVHDKLDDIAPGTQLPNKPQNGADS